MPLDAIFMTALAQELRTDLIGGRVDKIYQPENDEFIFQMRGPAGAVKLLISTSQQYARAHLTRGSKENPATPPMFCMLLRKQLTGAKLLEINQPPAERVLEFVFEQRDEMGDLVRRSLVAELMGRNSNLLLCGPDGIITGCIRRVDEQMSARRQVQPGLRYHLPPMPDKCNPTIDMPELQPDGMAEALLKLCVGISPLVARELEYRAKHGERPELFWRADILAGRFTPVMLWDGEEPRDFSYMELRQYDGRYRMTVERGFSALLDLFYDERDKRDHMRARSKGLHRQVENLRSRCERKLELQREELAATANRERLRECGDLLMANLHRIEPGAESITVADFYSETGEESEIKLSPAHNAHQNAARYYKNYQKAKGAAVALKEQIERGERDKEYLESVLESITRAENEKDLTEIRSELAASGFIKERKQTKQKQKPQAPHMYKTPNGFTVLAGRNNKQNDELTLKTALKSDIWLHTKKIHGAHVIMRCDGSEPEMEDIVYAAQLAAYHSQARGSENIPVDYAPVRNVKKPGGARPGMVIYDKYKTIWADAKLPE